VLRSLWGRIWRVHWLTVPPTIAFAQFSVNDEYGLVKIVSLRDPWRLLLQNLVKESNAPSSELVHDFCSIELCVLNPDIFRGLTGRAARRE
jgi:hypothetical protein